MREGTLLIIYQLKSTVCKWYKYNKTYSGNVIQIHQTKESNLFQKPFIVVNISFNIQSYRNCMQNLRQTSILWENMDQNCNLCINFL